MAPPDGGIDFLFHRSKSTCPALSHAKISQILVQGQKFDHTIEI